ncbi:MAG: uracil-DNA glycosylase, partial [Paracoccaceae bacterium]
APQPAPPPARAGGSPRRPVGSHPPRPGGRGAAPPPPQPPDRPGGSAVAAAAADLAAAATTLAELEAAIRDWDGSELKRGARRCVFADGAPGARVMAIGEAPGSEEDRLGKPFVGPAGRLLDRMLGAIGLARGAERPEDRVYITNVLPWRPPGNRTPSEPEIAAFLPFLERHVALAAPEILLLLGNTPNRALFGGPGGIRRLRGTWRAYGGPGAEREIWSLASFHPAYLMRQPEEKAAAWRDLLALRAVLDGADPAGL